MIAKNLRKFGSLNAYSRSTEKRVRQVTFTHPEKSTNLERQLVRKKLLSPDGPPSNYQEYSVLTFSKNEKKYEERRIASREVRHSTPFQCKWPGAGN